MEVTIVLSPQRMSPPSQSLAERGDLHDWELNLPEPRLLRWGGEVAEENWYNIAYPEDYDEIFDSADRLRRAASRAKKIRVRKKAA